MGGFGFFLIIIAFFFLYFVLVRPQKRRQLQQQQMLNAVKVGDEIVTAGGLYGTITDLEEDEARVEIADGIEVRVAKRAIAGVLTDEEEDEEDDPDGLSEAEETPGTLP